MESDDGCLPPQNVLLNLTRALNRNLDRSRLRARARLRVRVRVRLLGANLW